MKLVKFLLFLVIIAVIGLVVAGFFIDGIAVKAVEEGGTYALGVDTTLDSASIGLTSGTVGLSGLTIANPAGFETPHFFRMNSANVAVTLGSLMEDTVEVPEIALDGLSVNLEDFQGKANYERILENLGRFESGEAPAPESAPAEGGKSFVIKTIAITNVSVSATLLPIGGNATRTTFEIPEIRLHDVGSGGDGGMTLPEIINLVVKAVLGAITNAGINLPGNLLQGLQGGLGGLADVGKFGGEIVGEITGGLGEAIGGVTGAVDDALGGVSEALGGTGEVGEALGGVLDGAGDAVDGVGEGVKDALGGLGGLLGGNKDKKKKDDG